MSSGFRLFLHRRESYMPYFQPGLLIEVAIPLLLPFIPSDQPEEGHAE